MAKASVSFTLNSAVERHDVKVIKQQLDALPGVTSVSVNAATGLVAVDYDDTGVQRAQLQKQLEKMGFTLSGAPEGHSSGRAKNAGE